MHDETANTQTAFQDMLPGNTCFGCGAANPDGLQIKSRWCADVPGDTVCEFHGAPHHNAGSAGVMNGGIIATIMDCHSVITAVADAYRRAGRTIGSTPLLWYVTGQFDIRYQAPVLLARPVRLSARVETTDGRKSVVSCELTSAGRVCTTSRMTALQVDMAWHDV